MERDTRISAGFEERTQAEGLGLQLRNLGEAVPVVVVPRAVAVLTINIKSRLTAVGDERGIGRGDVVVAAAVADRRDRVADFGAVTVGVLGDDVDRATDGRGAEERRTASAHHLDAVDHAGRNLLQSINARKGRKDRMRIDENLRIVSVESVDTHLHKTAVLTVVLNAYAGLETKPLSQTSRVGVVENLAVEDVHQGRSLATRGFAAAGRNDYVVHGDSVFRDLEVEFEGLSFPERYLMTHRIVTHHSGFDGNRARRQVLQEIVPARIGGSTDGRAGDRNSNIRQMFACFAVDDMTVKMSVALRFRGRFVCKKCMINQAHYGQEDQFFHIIIIRRLYLQCPIIRRSRNRVRGRLFAAGGCVCNEVLLNLLLGMDSGRYAPKWIHNIILCFKM